MLSLDMCGPYNLTVKDIVSNITKISAGNYALGYMEKDIDGKNKFIVKYIGRSDFDLAARLKQHVGENYKKFKYSYAKSQKDAFEKECKNYHDFGGNEFLNNEIHPDRPEGKNWKCPYCDNY